MKTLSGSSPILSESWPLTPSVIIRVQLTIGGGGAREGVTSGEMRSNEATARFFTHKSRQDSINNPDINRMEELAPTFF